MRDEFFADSIVRWFSAESDWIAPEWFAEVWRTNPEFRQAVTHETKRYVLKVGALADPGLLVMLGQALTRDEILAFAEELRRHARGRVTEWGAEFEKAFAALGIVLPVPADELEGVGGCLESAIRERDLDRVRFLVRCMRDVGMDPEQATYQEYDCELSAEQLSALPREEWVLLIERLDSLPIRHLSVVEFAESEGLPEFVAALRSGGGGSGEPGRELLSGANGTS